MECPSCKTEHDRTKKFCPSCGTPLGITCERCGSVNGNDDKFCGACGIAILNSDTDQHPGELRPNIPRQYSAAEIVSLLSLRMAVEDESQSTQAFSQKDIDTLFE